MSARISNRMIAGRVNRNIARDSMESQMGTFAGGRLRSMVRRQISGHSRESETRLEMIAEIRLAMIWSIAGEITIRMIAGRIRTAGMRRWSAEVLLFLNFEHLTTPWARGHRG
jgi:hypothetical protein